ncbi:ParB/RepB/Spo0J family partition protein [Microvirga calopogonii]|uniref:ParB/RepB/Spo0J family partition protein n=1 Tax=Microvirga calopogonii TaxID=2078013 RepID=UPI000E0D7069|nr:ParB N-terminal domain-containing protein [Microvirga calopogonii]
MFRKFDVELPTSQVDLEELKRLEDTEEQTQERPRGLWLNDIQIADKVFQPRFPGGNALASNEHIRELAQALDNQGEPLDPILVTPIGQRFFLVDGHHRYAAYEAVRWEDLVPITVFEGTLSEAFKESIALNNKNKLPMTPNDRQELAWRLVKLGDARHGGYSRKQIVDMTKASDGAVANMRRVYKALSEQRFDLDSVSWRRARSNHLASEHWDREEWFDKEAKKLAEKLLKSGVFFRDKPDILARALEYISPGLPGALIEAWFETALALVEEHKEMIAQEGALNI